MLQVHRIGDILGLDIWMLGLWHGFYMLQKAAIYRIADHLGCKLSMQGVKSHL